MSFLFQLIPLLIILAIYAVLFKVAARIVRASRVGWPQAFQIAALVGVIAIGGRAASLYVGQLPVLLGALLGLGMQLALGAWFFRERAFAPDGQPLGWAGGAKLTAVAIGLLLVLGVVLAVGLPALVSMRA
jgi:hypothetical protein